LLLRLSLVLVVMVWAFDKILNRGHGASVLEGFYGHCQSKCIAW